MDFASLIDLIYEAAIAPERWITVLDQLAEIADAEGALLFAAAPGRPRWISSEKIRERMELWSKSPWFRDNPRGRRLVPLKDARFLTDLDAFTLQELDEDPWYNSFLRANGLGWCVGTSIRPPVGDTLVFSIEKAYEKGPVPRETAEQLDTLRAHLVRASLVSARLGLERAQATIEGLELVGLPAAILAHGGKVLAANRSFQHYAPDVRIGVRDTLEFANPGVQSIFVDACNSAPKSLAKTGRSIPVTRSGTNNPFVAHIVPLRGLARDIFTGAELLVYATPVVANPGPPPELLQALFDLTPAEARVSSMISEGQSVSAIARALSVMPNTVRTQLKSIFSKTGARRQAQLVGMLRFHQARSD
jgi:DNA-binding CsgD family transcriptional regulator